MNLFRRNVFVWKCGLNILSSEFIPKKCFCLKIWSKQWIYSKEMFLLENLVGAFADGGEIAVTSCHLIPRCPTLVSVSSFSINITFNLNFNLQPNRGIHTWSRIAKQKLHGQNKEFQTNIFRRRKKHIRRVILIDFHKKKIWWLFKNCKSTREYGNYILTAD